ncbi:MAG: SAM-dependent methyltransferase [Magnetococcales bacterium]|nr:SAM-dependent methyltransferase [Magnetococcales bacterium]
MDADVTRENVAMEGLVREAIARAGGALPFCRFMELALYHPRHGYYMTGRTRVGRGGDFVTAPELTSLFGELLALQCIEIWELLDRPVVFEVIEMGGGSGRLALDILSTARRFPAFFNALQYRMVEISPDFRERQANLLHEAGFGPERVSWLEGLPEMIAHGVILGNEFLDAMPVHWVAMTSEGLRELAVTTDGRGALKISHGEPCQARIAPYFEEARVILPVGFRDEVGLAAWDWMADVATRLRRGVVVMIDYGEVAQDHFTAYREAGTLVGHRDGERVDDPLLHPGAMDLTAHVNFSAMARAGSGGGLEILGFTSQGWFLQGLGILERLEMASRRMAPEAVERLRKVAMRLLLPDEMGERFKVLAMGRGIGDGALSGFRLNDQRKRL